MHDDTSAFVQLRFLLRMVRPARRIQRCCVYSTLHTDASAYLRCGLRPGWLLMLQGSQTCAKALRSPEMNEHNYIGHKHRANKNII